MEMKNRGFLDMLPAPFATLDSWRTTPPFPLLGSGSYRFDTPSSEYSNFVDFLTTTLQDWDMIELETLLGYAAKSFSIYCSLSDVGDLETNQLRADYARLAYQLCLSFRDAVTNLELREAEEAKFGFHLVVCINHYNDPE